MFDLDRAIREWRQQMAGAGLNSRDLLDELESHLREDVEQRMRSGATAEEAFQKAVLCVGSAASLNQEFAKLNGARPRLSRKTIRVYCLAVALFVFLVESWTLIIYEVAMPGRILGIGFISIIACYIGALPDINRMLQSGVRSWAFRNTILAICNCAAVVWVGVLFLSLAHINLLPSGMVFSAVYWGLISAATMTAIVFALGTEPEAQNPWAPAVWQSLEFAGAEAARFHHGFVGTEHVLLGLMENDKVRKVLENLGVRRESVRIEIERIVPSGPQSDSNRPEVYTPRAQKALRLAIWEAKAARLIHAEPEHVLLGLLREGGGVAAKVLNDLGVDAAKARTQILKQSGRRRTMTDFEPDIASWRKELMAAGIKNSAVLDELENHLREDIDRRVRSQGNISQLFQAAVAQFGEPQSLKSQFDLIKERKSMKRVVMIGAGILGVLVGMALVMPAVAQYRHEGVMRNGEPWLFLIGSFMTLAGCFAAIRNLKKARA